MAVFRPLLLITRTLQHSIMTGAVDRLDLKDGTWYRYIVSDSWRRIGYFVIRVLHSGDGAHHGQLQDSKELRKWPD
jgi:L-ascorbate metabolism protein UlaG (beta-lactamase superfamily)